MARNGSGTYAAPAADFPAVASTLIESTKYNNVINDIATAMSASIAVDGQTTVTANIPMNSKKFTGLTTGSARTDSNSLGQVQDGTLNWVDGGGTADAITATYSPTITALVDGQVCCVRATGANTITNPTFSPNGLTARIIYRFGGQALAVGDIRADQHELMLRYDLGNTRWELLNPAATVNASTVTVADAASDTTTFPMLATSATGNLSPATDAGLSYNASTNVLTATGGIDTGTITASGVATFNDLLLMETGTNIASAATIDLSTATGNTVNVTGTTATSAVTMANGQWSLCVASGAWPLTYHATTNKISSGADYTLTAGDMVFYTKTGASNVRGTIFKADGTAVSALTLATEQATTSGASIEFTSLPATIKRITFMFNNFGTNGIVDPLIQIGDSGGYEVTGYLGGASDSAAGITPTTGFGITGDHTATTKHHGSITLTSMGSNKWIASGSTGRSDAADASSIGGSKTLSGTLDRIRIITTDTLDSGSVNIMYE